MDQFNLMHLFYYALVCMYVCIYFAFFRASPAAYAVPRLGVESELQLPPLAAATAMPDPSLVCDLLQLVGVPDPLTH